MRLNLIISVCIFLIPGLVRGQSCYDYPCVIRKVKEALAAKHYQSAFNNLESAAAYPGSRPEEIATLRQELFNSIQQEKEKAESERKRAEQAENRVRNSLRIVQQERDQSDALRKEAEKNSEINRLTAKALEIQSEDPGLAADLAHYAFGLSGRQHPLAAKIRRNMYQDPEAVLNNTRLVGHREKITAMAFSPDGQYLLTGSQDRTAILWDLQGTIILHFNGHEDDVTHVSFSPDGRYVLTGSQDFSLKLWDLEGHVLQTFTGHTGYALNAVFSADGQQILSNTYRELKLWDISGRELTAFEAPADHLEAISFIDHGRRIAGVNTYGEVMIWDLQGKLLSKAGMQIDNLLQAVFSPDGARLLVNSIGGKTQLWDMIDNTLERELIDHDMFRVAAFSSLDGHLLIARTDGTVQEWELSGRRRGPVRHLGSSHQLIKGVFSPDGRRLLTVGESGPAELWDLDARQTLRLGGHRRDITAMIADPDGQQILTGSSDGELISWTTDGRKNWSVNCYAGKIQSLSFRMDGEVFAVGSEAGQIEIRHRSGVLLETIQGPLYRFGLVWSVAFSPNGRFLLFSSTGGYLEMHDLESGHRQALNFQGDEAPTLTFSPDGNQLLLGSDDGIARRYNLAGEILQEYRGATDRSIGDVRFSPDGQRVLAAKGNLIYIWDLNGQLLDTLSGHAYDIRDLAVSPDGRYILSGSYDETAKLWNAEGQLLASLKYHIGAVTSVDFLMTCETCPPKLLTAGEDQLGMIWDIEGRPLHLLGGHQSGIQSVAITSDGELMATAGDDYQIHLWDGAGHTQGIISGHDRGLTTIRFSPDQKSILSGSLDRTAKLWNTQGKLLQTFAGHEYGVKTTAFFPDGRTLLTAAGGELRFWNRAGQLLHTYKVPFNIAAVAIAADGTEIALAGGEGLVVRLDANGSLLREIQTEPYPIYDLTYSPNGKKLLLAQDAEDVLLLDLDGRIIHRFEGHHSSVYSVAFSPACKQCGYEDGRVFASGGKDGFIFLWDIDGEEVQRFPVGNAMVADLAFTSDGTKLLAGLDDGNAILLETLETYFADEATFSFEQSQKYDLPFDFRKLREPGLILEYGLGYLDLAYDIAEINLPLLDSSRLAMEYLVANFGPGYRFFLSEVLYNYGALYFRRGQFAASAETYEKILEDDPASAWLNVQLATTLIFAGEWEKARAIYGNWLGQPWDQSYSSYARTWDEAFYKYLQNAEEMIAPTDPELITVARNFLLEAMSR